MCALLILIPHLSIQRFISGCNCCYRPGVIKGERANKSFQHLASVSATFFAHIHSIHTLSWKASYYVQYLQRGRYTADQNEIKMKDPFRCSPPCSFGLSCLSFLADLPVCLQACVSVFFGSCQPVRPKMVSSSLALYLLHFWHLPDIKGKTKACTHTALARSLKSYTVFYCTKQKKMHILNIRQDAEVCCLFVFNLSEYAA